MVGDPIGDFIVRIMNASAVSKRSVSLPYSKLKHAIAEKLVEAGYLEGAAQHGKKTIKSLEVEIAYKDGVPVVRGAKRVSKPGRRLYAGAGDVHRVKFGKGKMILSTPLGILTGEEARAKNVGGEQLFIIW